MEGTVKTATGLGTCVQGEAAAGVGVGAGQRVGALAAECGGNWPPVVCFRCWTPTCFTLSLKPGSAGGWTPSPRWTSTRSPRRTGAATDGGAGLWGPRCLRSVDLFGWMNDTFDQKISHLATYNTLGSSLWGHSRSLRLGTPTRCSRPVFHSSVSTSGSGCRVGEDAQGLGRGLRPYSDL